MLRRLLIVTVWMFPMWAVAQQTMESQGYTLEINQNQEAVEGEALTISMSIEPAGNVQYAALYYRKSNERMYRPVLMKKSGRTYEAQVPGNSVQKPLVKYYVRITNPQGDNIYVLGSPREPVELAVANKQVEAVAERAAAPKFDLSALDFLESEFEMLAAEDVVVSASKRQQRLAEAPSAVYVISAADIQAYAFTTFADVLRYAPGMDIYRVNDSNAVVGVRGFADERNNLVLVLIDGREVNVELFGSSFLDNLPVSLLEIERIEIVRGPGSTLYGANAFSGIINVITHNPQRDSSNFRIFAAGEPRFRSAGRLRNRLRAMPHSLRGTRSACHRPGPWLNMQRCTRRPQRRF